MDHYIDIRLRPDPELTAPHVMSALYTRLHHALVAQGSNTIGVSFPVHRLDPVSLGEQMRLHGSHADLGTLMNTDWLRGVRDHVVVAEIAAVPSGAKHRLVSRVQVKSSPDRLRRRLMKRHGLDEAEARMRIPDSAAKHLELPFVVLGSRSTGQAAFRLFVRHGELGEEAVSGSFSSYGLSATATVPWF